MSKDGRMDRGMFKIKVRFKFKFKIKFKIKVRIKVRMVVDESSTIESSYRTRRTKKSKIKIKIASEINLSTLSAGALFFIILNTFPAKQRKILFGL